MHLLDSDVVIWHLRNRRDIVSLVARLSQMGRLAVSALTRLEVGIGMKEDERAATQDFLDSMMTLDVTPEIADLAGEFIRRYRSRGVTLDLVDAVIAATAAVQDWALVTLNAKHYPMPEVRLYFERGGERP